MRRREFITLLGGTALVWPLVARAQQPARMRRIGVLTPFTADDAEGHARLTAFAQGLQQLGWTVGQNMLAKAAPSAGTPCIKRLPARFQTTRTQSRPWMCSATGCRHSSQRDDLAYFRYCAGFRTPAMTI
jgi:hypothetical protein